MDSAAAEARLINAEAHANVLEQKYLDLRATLTSTQTELSASQSLVLSLRDEISSLKASSSSSSSSLHALAESESRLSSALAASNQSCEEERQRADRTSLEADRLRTELDSLNQQLRLCGSELASTRLLASQKAADAEPARFEIERLRKERDASAQHRAVLEKELEVRSEDLANARKARTETSLDMQALVDDLRAKLARSELDAERRKQELISRDRELEAMREALRAKESDKASLESALADLEDKSKRLVSSQKARLLELEKSRDDLEASLSSRRTEEERHRASDREAHRAERDRLGADLEAAKKDIEDLKEQLAKRPESRALPSAALTLRPEGGALLSDDGEAFTLTELYDKWAAAKDALEVEKVERDKAERYLTKILSEMEKRAPLFTAQKRERDRAVEDAVEARSALFAAQREAEQADRFLRSAAAERDALKQDNARYRQEGRDLAEQVQALLQSKMGEENQRAITMQQSSSSTLPVTFDDVRGLHENNMQLLSKVRHLEALCNDGRIRGLEQQIEAAAADLEAMKEERSRQETMVDALAQQRDLYRTLLSQSDARFSQGGAGGASPMRIAGGGQVPMLLGNNDGSAESEDVAMYDFEAGAKETLELRKRAATAEAKVGALEDMILRKKEFEAELEQRLDKAREEASKYRMESQVAKQDVEHYKSKCERLSKSFDDAQLESKRKDEAQARLQANSVELQKQAAAAETAAQKARSEKTLLASEIGSLKVERDASRAAEARLQSSSASLREELTRQEALVESVRRIEAGLDSRASEERTRLVDEAARLVAARDADRQAFSDERQLAGRRLSAAEDQLRAAESARAEALASASAARERATAAEGEVRVLKEKCTSLERQIAAAATASAARGEGSSEGDAAAAAATTTTATADPGDSDVSSLQADLQGAQHALAAAKEHVKNYQLIAQNVEKELKEMSSAYERFKRDTSAEIEQLKSQAEASKKLADSKAEVLETLGADLLKQQGIAAAAEASLKEEIARLTGSLSMATTTTSSTSGKMDEMLREIETHMANAKSAQANYERELSLHSQARSALREARESLESEQRLRMTAETQISAVTAEAVGKARAWEEEKGALLASLAQSEESLKLQRSQTTMLHQQVTNLASANEKIQSSRTLGFGGSVAGEGSASSEEVEALRNSVGELREIVHCMRSEAEMRDSKIEVLKQELECERASANIAKRSLDEARGELRRREEGEKTSTGKDEEHESLKAQLHQLNLLRESNSMLREANERNAAKLEEVSKALVEATGGLDPLRKRVGDLEGQTVALTADKESLGKEVNSWKERVRNLTSKFQQIDPEDHAKAVARAESAEKERDAAKAESASVTTGLAKLRQDLAAMKESSEATQKNVEKLTAEKAQLAKDLAAAKSGGGGVSKKEVTELQAQLAAKNAEIEAKEKESERLRGYLQRHRASIDELKDKIKGLEAKESSATAEGGGASEGAAGGDGMDGAVAMTTTTPVAAETTGAGETAAPPAAVPPPAKFSTLTAAPAAAVPIKFGASASVAGESVPPVVVAEVKGAEPTEEEVLRAKQLERVKRKKQQEEEKAKNEEAALKVQKQEKGDEEAKQSSDAADSSASGAGAIAESSGGAAGVAVATSSEADKVAPESLEVRATAEAPASVPPPAPAAPAPFFVPKLSSGFPSFGSGTATPSFGSVKMPLFGKSAESASDSSAKPLSFGSPKPFGAASPDSVKALLFGSPTSAKPAAPPTQPKLGGGTLVKNPFAKQPQQQSSVGASVAIGGGGGEAAASGGDNSAKDSASTTIAGARKRPLGDDKLQPGGAKKVVKQATRVEGGAAAATAGAASSEGGGMEGVVSGGQAQGAKPEEEGNDN